MRIQSAAAPGRNALLNGKLNGVHRRIAGCGEAVAVGYNRPELRPVEDRGSGNGGQRGCRVAGTRAKGLPGGSRHELPLVGESWHSGSHHT